MKDFNWENYPRRILHERDPWLPFPGIYPTRWAIKMKWGERSPKFTHEWKYLGKPNHEVALFVREIVQSSRFLYVGATEFITNGAIASGHTMSARSGLSVNALSRAKCLLVDPWAGYPNERMITTWADYQLRPLLLTYKGHKFVIYATATAPTSSRLETYRNWLDNANIKFSRQ